MKNNLEPIAVEAFKIAAKEFVAELILMLILVSISSLIFWICK